MRLLARDARCGLLTGLVLVFCGYLWSAGVGWSEGARAARGSQLALSLPSVVVESPSIEHLIAARVRPAPPKRLGVRLPSIFVQPDIPAVRLPPRPVPVEKKPKPTLAQEFFGSFSSAVLDESGKFHMAVEYLNKNAPVEALAIFEELTKSTGLASRRAASLFWAGETLLRLRRTREAAQRRERLLEASPKGGSHYVAAARYALAQERCEARDYKACLALLEGQAWAQGTFAREEAIFLKGWARQKMGSFDEAVAAWGVLADEKGRLALRARVALGHFYLSRGDHLRAEENYATAESLVPAKGGRTDALVAERLYGIGWARLLRGRAEEARRAFSLFAQRYPAHPLEDFVRVGLLSCDIESLSVVKPEEWNARLVEFARGGRKKLASALRLQLAWKLFRMGVYEEASVLAGKVSDEFPLGRIYRIARIVEGLSQYHLDRIKRAYGILRLGADYPPVSPHRLAERDAARSAAIGTAFAAFRLKDFAGAREVLKHWASLQGGGGGATPRDGLATLWYGEAAFELGNLAEAERAFRAVPESAPEFYRALAGIAWVQYRRKNWKKAADAFDRVFEYKADGVLAAEALARAGEARFNLRNYDGALKSFEQVERKYKGSGVAREALYQKAKLLFRRSRFAAAEENFRALLRGYPKSKVADEARYMLALLPFRKGDYALAHEKLLDFVENHKDSPFAAEGYLRLADSSYNQGRYREADRLYRLMMTRYPSHPKLPEAVYGRLLSHLQLGEYADFLSGARGYIDRYPENNLSISLAFQIGEVLRTQRDLVGALQAYRDVVAQYPANVLAAQALLRIASIHRGRKNIDKALDAYEILLTRYPGAAFRADGLFGIGETLADIGRCTEAKQRLVKFLKEYPGHDYEMLARFTLGRCLVRLVEDDAALPHLVRVINSAFAAGLDLRTQAAFMVAEIHRKRRRYADAQRALDVVLDAGPPDSAAKAFFARAEVFAERGDPKAASEFLKLTYLYPDQKIWVARALERAGGLYEKAGRHSLALRVYKKMEKVAEDPAFRRKARAAIKRVAKRMKTRARR